MDCDTTPVAYDWRIPYLAQALASGAPDSTGDGERQAIPYTYIYHVPDNLPDGPVPLLIALHGLGGSGPQFAAQSQWMHYADANGFIVAFPTGPRRWDTTEGSFDVGFIRDIVAQIRAERCVDPYRIWAIGHSYGGFMTQRMACDAGDLFAAGAVVSGGDVTFPGLGGPCEAGQTDGAPAGYEPVPLAFWHGTADQVVPYTMGRNSYRKWLDRYQCEGEILDAAAPYGPRESAWQCTRADITQREAAGHTFRMSFHSYQEHRHGYPDGCGGQGAINARDCEPDASTWPTLDFHHREVLEFLTSQARARPAAVQETPVLPSSPSGSDPAAILMWISEYAADRQQAGQ